ncbi:MAG: xylulokinase [Bacillota bacterium]
MNAILAYDLGTTGLKTALYDPGDGRLLALAEREIPLSRPAPTWAEQEPYHWWEAVVSTTHAVLAAAPAGYQVASIGLSSQRETVVPVDEAGEPLGPAVLWMDRRALAEARDLAALLGADQIHQVTGMAAEPTFTAPKLLWLKRTQPDLFRRARWFLCPKDFLGMRLTGAPFLDPSMAARTALYDTRRRDWWPAALAALELSPERLAPVIPSAAPGGYLIPAAAATLGLPPGIPVAAGGGDRCCEALGAAAGEGRVMESTGTATNLSAVTDRLGDRLPDGILVTAHVVDGWLLEQGISTGGSVLKWLRDNVTGVPYAELDQLAAASRPGAGGLLLLPFFMGARATRWQPEARGALFGLTLGHRQGDLSRAVMEGVAMEVRACLDLLAREAVPVSELVSLGGGAGSPVWRQIKAGVTGRPVGALRAAHAASFGAMLLGAAAAGLIDDPLAAARRLNPVTTWEEPHHTAFYDQLYSLYNQLYRSVEGLYGALAALTEAAPGHHQEG